jgi:hypothetical protein
VRFDCVNDTNTAPRWDLLLPLIAAGVAGLMVALTFLNLYAFRRREALRLDSRIVGLTHEACYGGRGGQGHTR